MSCRLEAAWADSSTGSPQCGAAILLDPHQGGPVSGFGAGDIAPANRIMLSGSDGNAVTLGTGYYQRFFRGLGDAMMTPTHQAMVFMLGVFLVA